MSHELFWIGLDSYLWIAIIIFVTDLNGKRKGGDDELVNRFRYH